MTDTSLHPLPPGWRWARLGEVCEINPRRPADLLRADDTPTTFVPMSAVDERLGAIVRAEVRPFAEIRKGYTYFAEGDVLFAKITPCMQNGKHAIAQDLIGGFGFGTTEFHVLRPGPQITADWVHYFLRQPVILQAATAHFTGAVGQQRVPEEFIRSLDLPLPPLPTQRRIAALLTEQMTAVERARAAAVAQLAAARALPAAYLRWSFSQSKTVRRKLSECLAEISQGIGARWRELPVLGATRNGIAPAKEPVGKSPERYKFVDAGTIFYNPMRILIGSIAMVDEGDAPGITSPDYVVFKTREGLLHSRWFYHWLRSADGASFIRSLARGAVRERMLFRRLAAAEVDLPIWESQELAARNMQAIRPLETALVEQLEAINRLPAALLRRAFRGEL